MWHRSKTVGRQVLVALGMVLVLINASGLHHHHADDAIAEHGHHHDLDHGHHEVDQDADGDPAPDQGGDGGEADLVHCHGAGDVVVARDTLPDFHPGQISDQRVLQLRQDCPDDAPRDVDVPPV